MLLLCNSVHNQFVALTDAAGFNSLPVALSDTAGVNKMFMALTL